MRAQFVYPKKDGEIVYWFRRVNSEEAGLEAVSEEKDASTDFTEAECFYISRKYGSQVRILP
jgi:hypothetical protein